MCECQTSAYKCNSTCVAHALRSKNRYYYAAQEIYRNVSEIYPDAVIWLAGHSLGGATSSLVALTYGLPVVTFEAPGEAMASLRLGLPTPPGYNSGFHQQRDLTGGFHFGHTADPIFMGTCNTVTSACTIAGYAMQSVCHTGKTCLYDTVADFGWRVGVGNHRIRVVLKDVLEKYDFPASCQPMLNCTDCFNWEYFESNHSDTTSSTSSSSTSPTTTRTSTCKTPGWWGCLDETTTSKEEKSHAPTATTSCATPGWFGCKDPTTSPASTTAQPSPTSRAVAPTSTTCHTPGWFGCKDATPSTSTVTKTITSTVRMTAKPTRHQDPSPTATATSSCVRRAWYGWCRDWGDGIDEGAWKSDL